MSSRPTKRKPKGASPTRSTIAQPRLRVLAGPDGSGKSTIKSELKPQWIGVFVNADEMERDLKAREIADRASIFDNSGSRHKLLAEVTDFETIELASSLIDPWFLRTDLRRAFS